MPVCKICKGQVKTKSGNSTGHTKLHEKMCPNLTTCVCLDIKA